MHQNSKETENQNVVTTSDIPATLTDIQNKIFQVIASTLGDSAPENLSVDMDFPGLVTDSITFIKIIVSLEDKFDFKFDDDMLLFTRFPTFRSMVEYVESKILR